MEVLSAFKWALLVVAAACLLGCNAENEAWFGAPNIEPWDHLKVKMCGLVYASIHPLLTAANKDEKKMAHRFLQITWDTTNCSTRPHRVAIFRTEGDDNQSFYFPDMAGSLWETAVPGDVKGTVVSNFSVPRRFPGGWNKGQDLEPEQLNATLFYPFRAVLFDENNNVLNYAALKVRPNWMEYLRNRGLDNLRLSEMMFPGTHNSGSFSRKFHEADSQVVRFLLTQDMDMWEQLVWGVRYFDIRVGFYPQNFGDQQDPSHPDHGQKYWINHDMVRVQALRPILEDLRAFLKLCPYEFVILDFHRFPVGFAESNSPSPHVGLIAMIREVLGEFMLRREGANPLATLRDLIDMKAQLLVSYGDKEWQKDNVWLWPAIPQHWGNKQDTADLVSYLDAQVKTMNLKHRQLWAMMAELTPTMIDIMLNLNRSNLRYLANQVNHNITQLAREGYWFDNANIIAVDFIESTDLVRIAAESNFARAVRRDERHSTRGSSLWASMPPLHTSVSPPISNGPTEEAVV